MSFPKAARMCKMLFPNNYLDVAELHDTERLIKANAEFANLINDEQCSERKILNFIRDKEYYHILGALIWGLSINIGNKQEAEQAKKEKREAECMPSISAHTLRHTGCTRMAEQGLDMKVVQYIMGHANIGVTMEVYNHITERARIENEIAKMDAVQVV